MNYLISKLKALYIYSPQRNVKKVLKKLNVISSENSELTSKSSNEAISDILNCSSMSELLAFRIRQLDEGSYTFLGDKRVIDLWGLTAKCSCYSIKVLDWNWNSEINFQMLKTEKIIFCRIPNKNEEWQQLSQIRKKLKNDLYTIVELLLPFTIITFLQKKVDYYIKSFDEILPYYLGTDFFGPIKELNDVYNLSGKKVIEFGPFDGCQSAGLINLAVKSLDCVEIRSENITKTLAAANAFNWSNLNIIMNDFHDVNSDRYGKYDLAFAHGVYYHSISPFLFLENLVNLADNIFIGGFCATDEKPDGKFELLEYKDSKYRAKKYIEGSDFTAGINAFGYFFHKDDLVKFFTEQGFKVKVLSDYQVNVTAGVYLRFLAQR